MKTFKILLLSLLIFLAWSCEEDFEINAPYQDITVVYGLLDQGVDTIYLKINKAFLGDGNVMEMAKIADSSTYVNGLQAVVEEWENSTMVNSYQLDTITLGGKEEGIFSNPYQIIYYAPFEPDASMTYRLKINVNGRQVEGETELVNNFSISSPSAGTPFVKFRPGYDSDIKWESAKNGKRYEVVIRFKYKEVLFDSPDTIYTYVDWALGTKKSVQVTGGEDMEVTYSNDGFYNFISNEIPYEDAAAEANVKNRYTNDVDFIISVAALDFNTYLEVNEPSNSIIQDRPEFTNISNGTGLFSSRFKNTRTKKMAPESVVTILTDLPELKFVY